MGSLLTFSVVSGILGPTYARCLSSTSGFLGRRCCLVVSLPGASYRLLSLGGQASVSIVYCGGDMS